MKKYPGLRLAGLMIGLSLLILTDCSGDNRLVCSISGKAANFQENQFYIILNEIPDTINVRADGTFSKDLTVKEPGKNLEFNTNGEDIASSIEFFGNLSLPAQYLKQKAEIARGTSRRSFELWGPPDFPG